MLRSSALGWGTIAIVLGAGLAWPASYYTQRLNDPKAVYLTKESFAAQGDGVADDTFALQRAIDRVQETTHQGIVFVPEGVVLDSNYLTAVRETAARAPTAITPIAIRQSQRLVSTAR